MSYLSIFEKVRASADQYELIGDALIVEELPPPEIKTASGLVLSGGASARHDGLEMNKPLFVRVLLVGAGYYNEETGNDVPLEVQPGDICLIPRQSVNWLSYFGGLISQAGQQLGITREAEIRMRFKGQTGYDSILNLIELGLK